MKGKILANSNLFEAMIMTKMETCLGLPFLSKFSSINNYRKLKKLREQIDSKQIVNYLNALKSFSDFNQEIENILKGKMRRLLLMSDKNIVNIINIFKKYSNTIHEFELNLPLLNNKIDKDEFYKFMVENSKFDKSTFYKMLIYSNYKVVREAVINRISKNKIDIIINKISIKNSKTMESLNKRKIYGKNWRNETKKIDILKSRNKNTTYVAGYNIPGLCFIKDKVLADYWGKESLCCLKLGGAASELLDSIEKSPIAGEFVGEYMGSKVTTYVWDMVEIVDGQARKTLIFDNIEANININEQNTKRLFEIIKSQYGYKNVYLGTLRNDCYISDELQNKGQKKRQSILSGYDKKFKSGFTSADSNNLYTIIEKEDDCVFNLRKMQLSDLYNVKYLENYIYPNCDDDLLENVELNTPCYIIDSSTHIAGYFLTRYKYFKENETNFHQDNEVKWYSMKHKTNYIKKLYIEDIVLNENKKIKLCLRSILEGLVTWCKENSIDTIMLNPNKNSKALLKRLEENGIKVELEDLVTIEPTNNLNGQLIIEEVKNLI